MDDDFKSCHDGHPALDVGGGKVIYGGSCLHPMVKDADIYIGFDVGMKNHGYYPWTGKYEIYMPVKDQGAPSTPVSFKKLVQWVSAQLDEGKKAHAGCIGGHGRTGMFLSALVAYRKAAEDPIAYVRKNYCHKAVESKAQVAYLVKDWGCKDALPRQYPKTKITQKTFGEFDDWHGHSDYGPEGGAVTGRLPKYRTTEPAKVVKLNVVDSGTPVRQSHTAWSNLVNYKA